MDPEVGPPGGNRWPRARTLCGLALLGALAAPACSDDGGDAAARDAAPAAATGAGPASVGAGVAAGGVGGNTSCGGPGCPQGEAAGVQAGGAPAADASTRHAGDAAMDAGTTDGGRDAAAGADAGGGTGGPLIVVVDGSGSMADRAFEGAPSRYDAAREALVGSDGALASGPPTLAIGLVVYRGRMTGECFPGLPPEMQSGCSPVATCPVLEADLAPATRTFAELAAAFPVRPPGGSSATAEVLALLYADLPPGGQVLLLTDGEPDACFDRTPAGDAVVRAAAEARARGILTHVVGVVGLGPPDPDPQAFTHLDQVAAAGGTEEGTYPADLASLRTVLVGIVLSLGASDSKN